VVTVRRFGRARGRGPLLGLHTAVLALVGAVACTSSDDPPGSGNVDAGERPDAGATEPDAGGRPDGAASVCAPVPACDAPLPDLGPERSFRHTLSSVIVASGSPHHRGRDLLLRPGDPQVVIGKITYGVIDKDLKDEEVDVWLLRGCGSPSARPSDNLFPQRPGEPRSGSAWELLGTALTTRDQDHEPVEGVPDTGGRVYLEIPTERALEPGRHRIHLSVAGDRSGTDLFIQVSAGSALAVSDVDGTLTIGENEEFLALLEGDLPAAHPGAAEALRALAERGYVPFYLTARPEFLVERTREFLDQNGFPPGLVHTTTDGIGAIGDAAAEFKTADLDQAVVGRGYAPAYAFGNTETDAEAYDATGVPLANRLFFAFDDEVHGGRRFDDYGALVDELAGAPAACEPR
jgi:hypothetical protein